MLVKENCHDETVLVKANCDVENVLVKESLHVRKGDSVVTTRIKEDRHEASYVASKGAKEGAEVHDNSPQIVDSINEENPKIKSLLETQIYRQEEERLGWVRALIHELYIDHPLCPSKPPRKKGKTLTEVAKPKSADSRKVLFDCCHCPNNCVCIVFRDPEGTMIPMCDCSIVEGMCVNSLRYRILTEVRIALALHKAESCGEACPGIESCVIDKAREKVRSISRVDIKPRCLRIPGCAPDGNHEVWPCELSDHLMNKDFDFPAQTERIFQIAAEQQTKAEKEVSFGINVITMQRAHQNTEGNGDNQLVFVNHQLSDQCEVDIQVGETKIAALVDSGACGNCMSASFFESLDSRKIGAKVLPSRVDCIMANGARESAMCDVVLDVMIDGSEYCVLFHVLKGLNSPVILGRSFLKEFSMTLTFGPQPIKTVPVRLIQQIRIPAKSEVFVVTEVNPADKFQDNTEGIFENRIQSDIHGCTANREALVKIQGNRIPVQIVNYSDKPKTLGRGFTVGTFTNEITDMPSQQNINAQQLSLGKESEIHLNEIRDTLSRGDSPLPIDLSGSIFTEEQKEVCLKLLESKREAFVIDGNIGKTHLVEHRIDLQNQVRPTQAQPFRMSPVMRENLDSIVQDQLDKDILEKAGDGPWASPAFLVKKPNGKFRLVVDYRALNAQTIPQIMHIPRVEDTIDTVGGSKPKYLSAIDLEMGFHQVPIREEDREKTAFLTPSGKYRYKAMPMGLRNSPASFQSTVDLVLSGIRYKHCLAYMDDIIIFSTTFEEHMRDLEDVLDRLIAANLKLKPSKCEIGRDRIKFLGHILTPKGIRPTPDNIEKIQNLERPKTIKQTRRFLGMAGFYRKFIPNYGIRAQPLYDITKKTNGMDFPWGTEQENAFLDLKGALTCENLLLYPDFQREFTVSTDASDYGMGACLSQKDKDGHLRPVAYWAKAFKKEQLNYSTTDKEMAAIYFAVKHWKVYLEGAKFLIQTDHNPLKYILTTKSLEGKPRAIRWMDFLQHFDYEVEYVKGTLNVVPDTLSRLEVPIEKDRNPPEVLKKGKQKLGIQTIENVQTIVQTSGIMKEVLGMASDHKSRPQVENNESNRPGLKGAYSKQDCESTLERDLKAKPGMNRTLSHAGVVGLEGINHSLIAGAYPVSLNKDSVIPLHVPSPEQAQTNVHMAGRTEQDLELKPIITTTKEHDYQRSLKECVSQPKQVKTEIHVESNGLTTSQTCNQPFPGDVEKVKYRNRVKFLDTPDVKIFEETSPIAPEERYERIYLCPVQDIGEEENEDLDQDDEIQTRGTKGKKTPNNRKRRQKSDRLDDLASDTIRSVPVDSKTVKMAQRQDEGCSQIMDFLTNSILPEDDHEARALLLREEDYFIHEGILFRMSSSSGAGAKLSVRLVVPDDLKLFFLQQNHDAPHSGHLGMVKMLGKMRDHLFWRGMNVDVKNYCASCVLCCETKRATRPIKPPLTLRDPAPRPWDTINMDAIERLPESKDGNKHIITVIDFYSKYLIAWPQKDLKAVTLIEKFEENVVHRHGSVRRVLSDNGSAFISDDFKKFCAHYKISQTFTSAGHPQASGLVERANRSVLTVLRNYVNEQQNNWDKCLPTICFALNTTKATATSHSPYLLLHGYEPLFPEMSLIPNPDDDKIPVIKRFSEHLKRQEKADNTAKQAVEKAAILMKERYDQNTYEPALREGDIVFLYMPRLKDQSLKLKLAKVYHGPYAIVRFHTDTTVYLKDLQKGKFLQKPVTISRLKRGNKRNMEGALENTNFTDPEPIEAADLPLDSFVDLELDKGKGKNRNSSEMCIQGAHNNGATKEQGKRINQGGGINNGALNLAESLPSSDLQAGPKSADLPNRPRRVTRQTRQSYKQIKGTKSENMFEVENMLDIGKMAGKTHVKLQFKAGEICWVPLEYMNEAAKKAFLSEDYTARDMPSLRYQR